MSKVITTALILFFLVIVTTWGWWEYYFPLSEFSRLGDLQFPAKSKVLEWHKDGWGVKGKFQIPTDQVGAFVLDNQLEDTDSEMPHADRCIHGGDNSVRIRLEKKAGIAEIEIQGPDHSGDKPCRVNQ